MPAVSGCIMALSPNMRGALFMSLSMAGFTFNDSIVKLLTSEMNVAQVIFLRGAVATLLIYLLALQRRALRPLRLLLDRWVAFRIIGELGGTLTFNAGWGQDAKPLAKFTDVRELQRELKAKGVPLVTEADESTTGPASFVMVDPDGNPILIDQHVRAPARRNSPGLSRLPERLQRRRLRLPQFLVVHARPAPVHRRPPPRAAGAAAARWRRSCRPARSPRAVRA